MSSKKLIVSSLTCFLVFSLIACSTSKNALKTSSVAADLSGSWLQTVEQGGKSINKLLLFSGNYFSWTEFEKDGGAFILTQGGRWERQGEQLMLHYEFDTNEGAKVGSTESLGYSLKADQLKLKFSKEELGSWKKLNEEKSPLAGPYLFASRKRNGQMTPRRGEERPRKTMKILTDGHFQWIAYNTETKQFFGTGGGTYSAKEGKYVEHIAFFSRDNSRVGASLEFEFEIKEGEWHHSGFSSKGDPMYEIWAKRK